MAEFPQSGVTVRAHVEGSTQRAEEALQYVANRIRYSPRLRKSEREWLSRQLAGVISDCEWVRLWLEAGCPEG